MNGIMQNRYELGKVPPPHHLKRYKDLFQSLQELNVLSLGVKTGLFEQLKQQKNVMELVEANNWNEVLTTRLLQCMYAFGFVSKNGGGYKNTLFVGQFATVSSPYCQVRTLQSINNNRNERIIKALENGPPEKRAPITEIFNSQALLGMAEHCVRGGMQQTIFCLNKYKKVREAVRMLDFGGGHSLYSVALTTFNPGLRSTVFDLPEVVAGAAKPVVKSHGADRIDFIQGDFMKDDLGHGYDLVLCSDVLHRKKDEMRFLLAKIYAAMNEGALLAVKETHLNNPKKNRFAAYFSLVLSTYGPEQKIYSSKVFESLIEGAGFKVISNLAIEAASDSSRLVIAERV